MLASNRFHYAWVIVVLTSLVITAAASVRAVPGVVIKPLEAEFGWDRASISFVVAVSILTFGLGGPLSGTLLDRFGPRRVMLGGLSLVGAGLVPLLWLRELWQLHLFWGLAVGIGTGALTNVLGASVAHRWFRQRRGLVIGLFGAATSGAQLVFLPTMMSLTVDFGWRSTIVLLVGLVVVLLPAVFILMRDRPEQVGLRAVGDDGTATGAEKREDARATPMREALRTSDFWLLAGSFFVCGYTTNGLVQTHLIPHAIEHGFTEVAAASAVGLMGLMNVVGTLSSGWLSDRFDNRKLLATYYGFRALSLAALPFILQVPELLVFAVVYGLDWIATVPPTANLTAQRFGRGSLGTIYGWIFFSHMVGAALAAYLGGFFREALGDYHLMFLSAAGLGFVAAGLSLRLAPARRTASAAA